MSDSTSNSLKHTHAHALHTIGGARRKKQLKLDERSKMHENVAQTGVRAYSNLNTWNENEEKKSAKEGDEDEDEEATRKDYDTKYNLIINDMHNMFNFKYFYYFIINMIAHILIPRDSFSLCVSGLSLSAFVLPPHVFVYYYKLHKYYGFDEVLKWLVGAEKCINKCFFVLGGGFEFLFRFR